MKSACTACLLLLASAGWVAASSFDAFNRGVAALNQRDFEASISFLDQALSTGDLASELKPVALVDRGGAYIGEGKYTEAVTDFDAALKLRPEDFEALSGQTRALAGSGNMGAALIDCEHMLRLWPYAAIVHEICGRLDWEIGNYSEATSRFESALGVDRQNQYSFLWLCLALLKSHSESKCRSRAFAPELDDDAWPSPITDLYLGDGSLERAEREANKGDNQTKRNRSCEVGFYEGEWQLLRGDAFLGRALLREAADLCPPDYIESVPAKSELERLNNGATR